MDSDVKEGCVLYSDMYEAADVMCTHLSGKELRAIESERFDANQNLASSGARNWAAFNLEDLRPACFTDHHRLRCLILQPPMHK
jgi:hypothetical protein